MTTPTQDQGLDDFLLWLRQELPQVKETEPPPPSPQLLQSAWQTLQTLQAAHEIEVAPPPTVWQRWRDRWSLGKRGWGWSQGLATVAVVMLVAVMLPRFSSSPGFVVSIDEGYARWEGVPPSAQLWPWGTTRGDRESGSAPPILPPEQIAFRYGVRQGLQHLAQREAGWTEKLAHLPEHLPSCAQEDTDCGPRQLVYAATGRWAVLVYGHCQQPSTDVAFWTTQEGVWRQLTQSLAALKEPTALAEALHAWNEEAPRAKFCGGVGELLALGLTGAP